MSKDHTLLNCNDAEVTSQSRHSIERGKGKLRHKNTHHSTVQPDIEKVVFNKMEYITVYTRKGDHYQSKKQKAFPSF